jgi:Fe2+ transport system protein B
MSQSSQAMISGIRAIAMEMKNLPEEFAENAGSDGEGSDYVYEDGSGSDSDSDSDSDCNPRDRKYKRHCDTKSSKKRRHSEVDSNKSAQIDKLETRIHYLKLDLVNREVTAEEDKQKIANLIKKSESFDHINQLMREYNTLIQPRNNDSLTSTQLQNRIDNLKNKLEANASSIQSYIDLIHEHPFLKQGLGFMMKQRSMLDAQEIQNYINRKNRVQFKETAMIASLYVSFILGLLLAVVVLYLFYSPSFGNV